MTNQSADFYQTSDNGAGQQSSPFESFMREFVTDFMRDLPKIIQEMQSHVPGPSDLLPNVSICDGNNDSPGNSTGGTGDGGTATNPPAEQTPAQTPEQTPTQTPSQPPEQSPAGDSDSSDRRPYNRKELGAQILLENFGDIDINNDNRLEKSEIRKFVKDEVHNPLDRQSIGKVTDSWDYVKSLSVDGKYGASQEDLERYQQRQVEKGVMNRYPAT